MIKDSIIENTNLPDGWEIKALGEACIINPKKSEVSDLSENLLVTFLPMRDLGVAQKRITPVSSRLLSEVKGSYTYFKNNDVILAKVTPCFENGKLGIAVGLKNEIGFGSSEYMVIRAKKGILSQYVFYVLTTDRFRNRGKELMFGAVGLKRLSKDYVRDFLVPVPPLTEQKQIVAIIDKAFAAIDTAKANAEQNLKNAKELFESYLQDVFENKGDDWEEKTLNEISENLDKQRIPITKKDRKEGDIPYYGASGIVDYVQDYLFDEELLCISEDGANLLARTYPIAFSISGKSWVNNHVHILRLDNITSQYFIEYYLNSIKLDDYISGMAQPKLNQTKLNKIPIPFPNLIKKQEKVVLKLDAMKAECKKLEAIYTQKIADLEEMKKSVLQKAFNGELKTEGVLV